jgi:hypothetical protein
MNFNWGGVINALSAVHISAAEASDEGTALVPLRNGKAQTFTYHAFGAADIWVSNVAPHAEGVEFVLHTWSEPVNVAVTITVEDQIEDNHRVGR